MSIEALRTASFKLWDFVNESFRANGLLIGPDPVGRINGRFWRFIKYYFPAYRRNDTHTFMQSQGYWIIANWILYEAVRDNKYSNAAIECSKATIDAQHPDGKWEYPEVSYERMGLVATVEGIWAALGLLSTYARKPQNDNCLTTTMHWLRFIDEKMGYDVFTHSQFGKCMAVNYYYPKPRGMVPNNTTMLINLKSLLHHLVRDVSVLGYYDHLINFINASQTAEGELFYHYSDRQHYLCYQYNAYEFMDLAMAYKRDKDERLMAILEKLAKFLERGQSANGACRNDCQRERPEMYYHTAALGNAYLDAYQIGLGEIYLSKSQRAAERLLSTQRKDGSWGFSEGDYGGLLSDGRAYPRYLAMTLYHLARLAWPDIKGLP